ncbi:MAG: TonB-dependent receptor plug domain-containing protein [Planctomycetota bacterium]|jgi:iron complex outermembrane receptor protein
MKRCYVHILIALLCGIVSTSAAGGPDPNHLFDMSLEELMDVPVVVSASRSEQKLTQLSVPVSIITAEDIHYSGLTSIPEILQFAPGVDVVSIDRVRYAVGVRGLHDFIADRTLTLIDGRAADSPIFGGSEFYRYPIMMEDIERIEIVRGPGGAAWGANAFTGVINIITKDPGSDPGWLLSNNINEYGDIYSHIRWMDSKDQWSWRFSVGYEDFEDSDAAGAGTYESNNPALNPLMGFDSFTAQDYSRNFRMDSEMGYDYSDDTHLSFGAGYSHMERGDWEMLGYYPGGDAWYETLRTFAKLDHTFDDETNGYVQWFTNYNNSKQPSLMKWMTLENDIEVQLNKQIDEHHLSIGGNFRFTHIDTEDLSDESLMYPDNPYDEITAGVFLIDRIDVADNLQLEGQFRSDWYSETTLDWSTRLSALYALDSEKDHNLRLSFARAFRTPYMTLREGHSSRVFNPGIPAYMVNLSNTGDLDNEETWSVEMGYSWQIEEGILLRTDAYFQRFEDLIGYSNDGMIPVTYTANNIDGADSWGVETELSFQNKTGKLSLWHSYNDFQEDQSHQFIRAYTPARHKAGVTGRLFLDKGLTLNANYRYATTTHDGGEQTTSPVEVDHRLDLTVAKQFAENRGQIMVGVADVFNETHGPNHSNGTMTALETPGRTFFGPSPAEVLSTQTSAINPNPFNSI